MKQKIILLIIAILAVVIINAQTGNFGIGTSTPGSKLTVNGSVGLAYTSITTNTYTIGANDYYIVWNGTANGTMPLPAGIQNQYFNLVDDLINSGDNMVTLYLVQGEKIKLQLQICSVVASHKPLLNY